MMTLKPMVLIILDGFGHSESKQHNPIKAVDTPTLDYLFSDCPNLFIDASGEAVGLPQNQMGNSEVGHLHLGAGRKVPQDFTRIQNYVHAILDGRDTAPKSAESSLKRIEALYQQLPGGQIASIICRYYAMDRDQRWERTQKAYDLL